MIMRPVPGSEGADVPRAFTIVELQVFDRFLRKALSYAASVEEFLIQDCLDLSAEDLRNFEWIAEASGLKSTSQWFAKFAQELEVLDDGEGPSEEEVADEEVERPVTFADLESRLARVPGKGS